ncbi:thermonuclease family protein [Fulvivirga sp.]|uniref:thermonuclease family protein n=1 Tax=Fulvivirga sp. TaxID=1931237 RepID=UPI0032F04741
MKITSLLFFIFISASTIAQTFTGKVVNIIDGNTFEIIDDYDEVTKFMLSEVDCPELGQQLSEEAKVFSEQLILKKKVGVTVKGKDMWGNKLVVIELKNGDLLHEMLIREGLAWASRKAEAKVAELEGKAKTDKKGIWAMAEPTPPWIYRRQQTMSQAKGR